MRQTASRRRDDPCRVHSIEDLYVALGVVESFQASIQHADSKATVSVAVESGVAALAFGKLPERPTSVSVPANATRHGSWPRVALAKHRRVQRSMPWLGLSILAAFGWLVLTTGLDSGAVTGRGVALPSFPAPGEDDAGQYRQ